MEGEKEPLLRGRRAPPRRWAAGAALLGVAATVCLLGLAERAPAAGRRVEEISCCSGSDDSCCHVGNQPWFPGATIVSIHPTYGFDVKKLAWVKEDVPAPEGAFLDDDKAMKIDCKEWDNLVGDHIGKSCGDAVYKKLSADVGKTAAKFLTEGVVEQGLMALRKREKFEATDKERGMLAKSFAKEAAMHRAGIVRCAREHSHVYYWSVKEEKGEGDGEKEVAPAKEESAENQGAKPEGAKAEEGAVGDAKEAARAGEKGAQEKEGAKEGEAPLWVDPIPDVAKWSRAHLAPAEKEEKEEKEKEGEENPDTKDAKDDKAQEPALKGEEAVEEEQGEQEAAQEEEGIEKGKGKGIMMVHVGDGFENCAAQFFRLSCEELSSSDALYPDAEEGMLYSVSAQQACQQPDLVGLEGTSKTCGVCCRLHDNLCAK
mmetsp:Transcript_58431/g.143314  ORF Transcript_58431/g.143314 Transcript_58431/m.143314 type:complete len:429 (+) Transcript_58431:41-1327(+)